MNLKERARAFLKLSPYIGVEVTSQFLRQAGKYLPQANIPCLHSLAEGIFKPSGDLYALSLWSRSALGQDIEVYHDLLIPQADGSWIMNYVAKKGSLDSAVNKSLFACMWDKVPLTIIVTSKPKNSPGGPRYKILGSAVIEEFYSATRQFLIRGCSSIVTSKIAQYENEEEAYKLLIRNQLIMPFYIRDERSDYYIKRNLRENAFRKIILEEYKYICSVCQSKFILSQHKNNYIVETEVAHIIPVKERGPDDPRNGLSLCRRHHWAFDNGLFTITDSYEIKISPSVLKAERQNFDLEEYDGESIMTPVHEICRPHEEALRWHQNKKFRLG